MGDGKTLMERVAEAVWARLQRPLSKSYAWTIETNGDPYLTKYMLWRLGPFAAYVHQFHRGDLDRRPHNHPWRRAVSLILVNGYDEERLMKGRLWKRRFRPGDVNVLTDDDFHRVDLHHNEPCWTLFLTYKHVQKWGYINLETGKFVEHDGPEEEWAEPQGATPAAPAA